jgi:hypothetical protein
MTFKRWFICIFTIIILGTWGFFMYYNKKQFLALGSQITGIGTDVFTLIHEILLVLMILVPLIVIGAGILAFLYIRDKHFKPEIIEIGQFGNALYRRGQVVTITPLQAVNQKQLPAPKEEITIQIPTIKQWLTSGYLQGLIASGEMVLGIKANGEIRTGVWDDIRTCLVAGKSRYGKSVTMFVLAIQAVLARADVTVCDSHFMKETSLYRMLSPLANFVRLAGKPNEVVNAVTEFATELDARINGDSYDRSVRILFIDEWTKYAMDKAMIKELGRIVHRVSNEGAGYNMYCIIGGQSWQASLSGGNALRNSFHAAICHHIDEMESKLVLPRKYAKHTDILKKGHMYLKDTGGDTELLITPLGTINDAKLIATLMLADNKIQELPYNQYKQPAIQPATQPAKIEYVEQKRISAPNEQTGMHMFPTKPLPPDVTNVQELKGIYTNEGKMIVSPDEEKLIVSTANKLIEQGITRHGKVIRTKIQEELGLNMRQYKKVELVCNKHGK